MAPDQSSHTSSREKGTSGIRISAAPPAIPAWTAIQPTCRPITSHTMTRWWDSAVVCRRSMASVAIWTAVSNPKVTSVPDRSLSMVLGTPTTGSPRWCSRSAAPRVSSPPMATTASSPSAGAVARTRSAPSSVAKGLVRDVPRMVPPLGQNGPAPVGVERDGVAFDETPPAVDDADELVAVMDGTSDHHGPDHRIQSGTVTAPGE